MICKYGDKVEVVGGFYQGQSGTVEDVKYPPFRSNLYLIQLNSNYGKSIWVEEYYLTKVDIEGETGDPSR